MCLFLHFSAYNFVHRHFKCDFFLLVEIWESVNVCVFVCVKCDCHDMAFVFNTMYSLKNFGKRIGWIGTFQLFPSSDLIVWYFHLAYILQIAYKIYQCNLKITRLSFSFFHQSQKKKKNSHHISTHMPHGTATYKSVNVWTYCQCYVHLVYKWTLFVIWQNKLQIHTHFSFN